MVKRVGVLKLLATVCPSSTALLSTTPSMGLVMVAYPRLVCAFFTFSLWLVRVCCALMNESLTCSYSLALMSPFSCRVL